MAHKLESKVCLILLTFSLFTEPINTEISSENERDDFVCEAGTYDQRTQMTTGALKRPRYLLYEVNHSEGFNLRRDVYMRMANLVLKLRELLDADWRLVLPPWGHLYHWKSKELGRQIQIPWATFFDLDSLNKHVPVIEFKDYLKVSESIDLVYYLQYFEDTFEEGNSWVDKYEERSCIETPLFYQTDQNRKVKGWFWGYDGIYAHNFSCLSLQGTASTIIPLITDRNESSIMLDRAETILHDSFGDETYWKSRRSMRFAKNLRAIGDEFRQHFLNSTDLTDGTILNEDWRKNKPKKSAKGGPFLGIHLRREDFLRGRAKHLPSLSKAAEKIKNELKRLNLSTVYVATDAPQKEFEALKSDLGESTKCLRFSPNSEEKKQLKDGGVAIVDQWIVSHARYFIGTHESTFTFRIQEEREILGFDPDTTFNRFCGDEEKPCEAPSRWRIVY